VKAISSAGGVSSMANESIIMANVNVAIASISGGSIQ
jgi:hypothetical protein